MLTRAGWSMLVGAVATVALGRLLGAGELDVLGASGAALTLVALAWVRRPVPELAVRRRITPPRVTVGGVAHVQIDVTNRGRRRSPLLTAHDEVAGTGGVRLPVAPLEPGASHHDGYHLPTHRRGLVELGPLVIEVADPFGLARRTLPGAGLVATTVLPSIDAVAEVPMGGGRHEPVAGTTSRAVASSGAEDVATLRPYVVGDELRRVHWPSSAHAGDLVVRRDEDRWQGQVTVVLDARAGQLTAPDFERAVSAAAGLVHAVGEVGDRVRLVTTGGYDSGMVDARRGAGSLLEQLALVQPHDHPAVAMGAGPARYPSALVLLAAAGWHDLHSALDRTSYGSVVVVAFDHLGDLGRPGIDATSFVAVPPGSSFSDCWAEAVATSRRQAARR